MIIEHLKGGTPSAPPPPPAPVDAGSRVDKNLLMGRKKRMGYQSTVLGGGSDQSKSLLGN